MPVSALPPSYTDQDYGFNPGGIQRSSAAEELQLEMLRSNAATARAAEERREKQEALQWQDAQDRRKREDDEKADAKRIAAEEKLAADARRLEEKADQRRREEASEKRQSDMMMAGITLAGTVITAIGAAMSKPVAPQTDLNSALLAAALRPKEQPSLDELMKLTAMMTQQTQAQAAQMTAIAKMNERPERDDADDDLSIKDMLPMFGQILGGGRVAPPQQQEGQTQPPQLPAPGMDNAMIQSMIGEAVSDPNTVASIVEHSPDSVFAGLILACKNNPALAEQFMAKWQSESAPQEAPASVTESSQEQPPKTRRK